MLDRLLEQDDETLTIGQMLWENYTVKEQFREQILEPMIARDFIEEIECGIRQRSHVEAEIFDEYFEDFAFDYWNNAMMERAETLNME